MTKRDRCTNHGPSWTKSSFLDALQGSRDRARAERLFELLEEHPDGYYWFGQIPNGAIFFHLYGLDVAPLRVLVGADGGLLGKGTWTSYPKIRNDERFAELAGYLGQDHSESVADFSLAEFDVDELWSVTARCARLINGVG
ncbi:hypothetical protein [Mycolicibacterium brumae]|uniref:hypothetical protein n=1 Tax=Mycolicibacterium brumae TaxID=85968 RepID=UPI000FE18A2F|nr:hypothetical protein [Mycolicibacterium brumae]MCV7191270.1 hypothetical protein [Mycolicibacterium brumae]UWW09723.1 hypothetical protein L2Z93_002835 [Mycolicibacterium brumae]